MTETHWKVLTHDYRPPVQGGDPCDNCQLHQPRMVLDVEGRRWRFCSYGCLARWAAQMAVQEPELSGSDQREARG